MTPPNSASHVTSRAPDGVPAGLTDVLVSDELARRPARLPDLTGESAALLRLARRMATDPSGMLDALVGAGLDLCRAGTAGVSVSTANAGGEKIFRWDAIVGALAPHIGGTTPRHFSPCGVAVDCGTPQLFDRPARYYTYFAGVQPEIVEALVVPFGTSDGPHGAIWLVSHGPDRRFDWEDARVMTTLGHFTAAALVLTAALSAASKARDAMLATVTHDLKSPLVSVKGYAALLRRLAGDGVMPTDALAEAAVHIETSAIRMAGMVDNLHDLAVERSGGCLRLNKRPGDLVALTARAVHAHQGTTDNHSVLFVADRTALVGTWDQARLERLLDNLLGNAVKYSPRGGEVLVELRAEENPTGSWAVLTVRDEGLGIPRADLPRVFEQFHRGANVAERIAGTGVGLASALRTVAQHGGTIAVESVEGEGTTFTVRLPLAHSG